MPPLEILNCAASGRVDLDAPCPVGWEAMADSGSTHQRICGRCGHRVYQCIGAADATLRLAQDEILALPPWLVRGVRALESVSILDELGHRYAHRIAAVLGEREARGEAVDFAGDDAAPPAAPARGPSSGRAP